MPLHREQRQQLEALVRAPDTPTRVARRARIVLRAAEGAQNRVIAAELGTSPAAAALWRQRFLSHGVAGLVQDAPRSGRPPRIPEAKVQSILRAGVEETAPTVRRRSARSLAGEFEVSKSSVQRLWRAHGIRRLPRPAPPSDASMEFLERVTDLVGLYLYPPERAVAFSTDERVRANPFRRSNESAAPREPERDRAAEFRAFLQMTDRETPRILDVHLLLDSRVGPVPPEVERWLRHHPRFHLHFLPADRVGLTLIDRLIEGFSRRKDRPGASASAHRLKYALREHLLRDLDSLRPFVWTAASGDIRGAYGRRAIQQ